MYRALSLWKAFNKIDPLWAISSLCSGLCSFLPEGRQQVRNQCVLSEGETLCCSVLLLSTVTTVLDPVLFLFITVADGCKFVDDLNFRFNEPEQQKMIF